MPYSRPTLTELRTAAAADLTSSVPGTDGLLRFSNLGVMVSVLAAMANGLYGYLDYIAQQATPFTATDEYLEGWAALKGVTRGGPTSATGQASFPVSASASIPVGFPIQRSDGVAYVTTSSASASSGTITVDVECSQTGSIGNCDEGALMSLASPIANITSQGSAATPFTGGTDTQSDDSLRTEMLQDYAAPPQGGANSDYVEWALAVPGVTRAWVFAGLSGPGTLSVYFMMDEAEASHNGFPQGSNGVATAEPRAAAASGDQLAVANSIFPKQPVTPIVYAVAPGQNTVSMTINGLASAGSTVQSAVEAAISAALVANSSPGGETQLSAIEAAIAQVSGTAGFVITTVSCSNGTVSPGTDGNITSSTGYLPLLGTVTWT